MYSFTGLYFFKESHIEQIRMPKYNKKELWQII